MEIRATEVKLVPLEQIQPHPKNPNKHKDDQIERLIKLLKYTGFRNPLVVSNLSGFLVAGHGRLEAAKRMKDVPALPVIFQDFANEAEEYAYMTADNAIAEWSSLDKHGIQEAVKSLKISHEFDLEWLGMKDFKLPEVRTYFGKDEDVPAAPSFAVSKTGDVWVMDGHRLMCGDSTMIDDVEKLMNGRKAELVFTDPPYRMETAGGGFNAEVGNSIKKKMDAIKHLCDFDPVAFLNGLPLVFEKGIMNCYIFCNKDLVPDYLNWANEAGYSFNILFWKKPNAAPMGGSHRPDVEYLLLFRKSATWNNAIKDVSYSRCLEFGRVNDKVATGDHPTPKPVELIENEIKISSTQEGIVVDFFTGSGSTLIAAEKNCRYFFGMEMDPKYVDVAVQRWQNFTGKKAYLESTNEDYDTLKEKIKG